MAGLSEGETVGFISAGKEIMLRFGSTRWLNTVCALGFLYAITRVDAALGMFCLGGGLLLSVLTLVSFHFRPHSDAKP